MHKYGLICPSCLEIGMYFSEDPRGKICPPYIAYYPDGTQLNSYELIKCGLCKSYMHAHNDFLIEMNNWRKK